MTNQVAVKITCPNPECQAPNLLSHNFCAYCRTPIPRIYLWAIGDEAHTLKVGQVLGNNRYVVVNPRVLLDTKPGWQPETVDRVPEEIIHYLRLIEHRPHIPQVYGAIPYNRTGKRTTTLWLLEKAPIYSDGLGSNLSGELMPELTTAWKGSASIRQLNWMWQIAQLWGGMSDRGVATTLLTPEVLRVESGLLRVLELVPDRDRSPTLADLGTLWQQWQKQTRMSIAPTVEKICNDLIHQQIINPTQLISALDEALRLVGQKQFLNCNYVTLSHTGPTREGNEDACYPPSGTPMQQNTGFDLSLAIVCDGVGGHQGGEVASNLAINTIRQRLESVLNKPENRYPDSIAIQIETSTCVANDQISLRNDSENRQERQRMGTTMVTTLIYGHEAYIAHIGDSRVYRITRTGCHQMTLDDDLATREVRLAGMLYREALNVPSAGALFQALGMNSSTTLHPNVRRLIVDEECIFLLCSDGVSDNDRVDQYWQREILPVLEGQVDLTTACQRVINMANTYNGHDNASVALIHCQVKQPIETGQTTQIQDLPAEVSGFLQPSPSTLLLTSPETKDAQQQTKPHFSGTKTPLLLGIVGLLLLTAIGATGWFLTQGTKPNPTVPLDPAPTPSESPALNLDSSPSPAASPTNRPVAK
jgi:serine/threonine protein phosphatase PrpC